MARYRAGVASLLAESVTMTRKLERWLDVTGGWHEATAKLDLDADPTASVRITCALLLRKARIHSEAVLRANETNNIHSLAVQMRPVLECAGQVVSYFRNLIIASDLKTTRESALRAVSDYLNADYYRTIMGMTKGGVGHKELLDTISAAEVAAAASVGAPKPKARKGRSLTQASKVASLAGGKRWYDYLSEHFIHEKADLTGPSWRGGVISMHTVQDEVAFAGMMDYLVEQVACMNWHTALCPVAGDTGQWRELTWEKWRYVRESSKALRDVAIASATEEPGANARSG